jgi:hypothetical protein
MAPSRARSGPSRTVGASGVETKLESLCVTHGAEHLNVLRDQARTLAPQIGREKEFDALDKLIGALLGTRDRKLHTIQGRARRHGKPLDVACVDRLVKLANFLLVHPDVVVPIQDVSHEANAAGAFIESYFSNYIEGTRFTVDEAVEIVFDGKVPETRPEDGHDVLAAYLQLAELDSKSAAIDTNTFIAEIKERHRKLLQDRPSANPGLFKQQQNQAGDTVFTRPEMVEGTLLEGLRIFKSLKSPFSRAMFVHFMLSDVHPFTDGNGRLSRIMTRKELASAGLSRIVVPTVFRNDYIDGLRVMSRRSEPSILVRTLEYCQRVSAACSAASVDEAIKKWASAYAFCEDTQHARLTMPNPALTIESRNGVMAPTDYWEALSSENAQTFKLQGS